MTSDRAAFHFSCGKKTPGEIDWKRSLPGEERFLSRSRLNDQYHRNDANRASVRSARSSFRELRRTSARSEISVSALEP